MAAFYIALGTFVATTVAIAVTNSIARNYTWIAVLLGLLGAMFMLCGSVRRDRRIAPGAGRHSDGMEFVAVSRHYAGDDLAGRPGGAPFTWLGRRRSDNRTQTYPLNISQRSDRIDPHRAPRR